MYAAMRAVTRAAASQSCIDQWAEGLLRCCSLLSPCPPARSSTYQFAVGFLLCRKASRRPSHTRIFLACRLRVCLSPCPQAYRRVSVLHTSRPQRWGRGACEESGLFTSLGSLRRRGSAQRTQGFRVSGLGFRV